MAGQSVLPADDPEPNSEDASGTQEEWPEQVSMDQLEATLGWLRKFGPNYKSGAFDQHHLLHAEICPYSWHITQRREKSFCLFVEAPWVCVQRIDD